MKLISVRVKFACLLTAFVALMILFPTSGHAKNKHSKMPDDFNVEYRWGRGSVSEPANFGYVIKINHAGEGEITLDPSRNQFGTSSPDSMKNI